MPIQQSLTLIIFSTVFLLSGWAVSYGADEGIGPLTVETLSMGGHHAFGTFHVAAEPSILQAVITDYERWPELFDTELRMTKVERLDGRVITELFVSHVLIPGEKRLLCENREIPGGGLVTTRLEGDFKRYTRTWKMSPEHNSSSVKVAFELDMEVNTWAPDWMVALALQDELEMHFQLVRERAEEIAAARSGGKGKFH